MASSDGGMGMGFSLCLSLLPGGDASQQTTCFFPVTSNSVDTFDFLCKRQLCRTFKRFCEVSIKTFLTRVCILICSQNASCHPGFNLVVLCVVYVVGEGSEAAPKAWI